MSNEQDTGFMGMKELPEQGDFKRTVLEPGRYDAVVHAIVGIGLHETKFKGEVTGQKVKVKVLFEIPSVKTSNEETLVVGFKSKGVNLSFVKTETMASDLFKIINAVTGLTSDTAQFDLFKSNTAALLGKPVVLNITNWAADDGTVHHVVKEVERFDTRVPTKPEAVRETFVFDFFNPDVSIFKTKLTDFTQEQIVTAINADELPIEIHQARADVLSDRATTKGRK